MSEHSEHYMNLCVDCGVVDQCRCMATNKIVTEIVCDKCMQIETDLFYADRKHQNQMDDMEPTE
jgi:hypothetical protein